MELQNTKERVRPVHEGSTFHLWEKLEVETSDFILPEQQDPEYLLVFVPERRHTDSLMSRPDPRKTHRKMSKDGHIRKIRRPTGLEVYNDAARILEELLEKRIDDDVRGPHRCRRNKTDPTTERVGTPEGISENAVARSKTMPSKYRESKDEELKKKDLEAIMKKALMRQINKDGSESSADTDEDHSQDNEPRRKKSFFKRAKERLIHTFHRDQKGGFGEYEEDTARDSSHPKRRNLRKKPKGEIVNEAHRHVKASVNEDKTQEYSENSSYKDKNGSMHTEIHSVKKGKGSIFSSLRKSKHRSDKAHEDTQKSPQFPRGYKVPSQFNYECEIEDKPPPPLPRAKNQSGGRHSDQSSVVPKSMSHDIGPFHGAASASGPPLPPQIKCSGMPLPSVRPQAPGRLTPSGPPPPPSQAGGFTHPPPPRSKSPSPPSVILGTIKTSTSNKNIDACGASTSSSNLPTSESTNGGSSSNTMVSTQSSHTNILDSPGEEIEYMDISIASTTVGDGENAESEGEGNHTRSIRASGIKFHNSEGLLNLRWLADHSSSVHAQTVDYELNENLVSTRNSDGNIEVTTDVTASETVVLPDLPEEDGYDEVPPLSQKSGSEKDEMYGKIAQKLIDMADTYSASISDQESRGAAAAPSSPITDLEQEIIACLRSGGDRHSKQLDEKFEDLKQQASQDAYQRFRSTIQNSMGSEVSWDHLAFLFYTTKGVVSAVGKGSKAAHDAKAFTLRYISDTCASWIMDQGGFDTMLSGSESDYDLD